MLVAGGRRFAAAPDGGAGLLEEGQGRGMAGRQLERPHQLADGVLVVVDLHQQAGVAQQPFGGAVGPRPVRPPAPRPPLPGAAPLPPPSAPPPPPIPPPPP